jgi:hypothetical protein
MLKRAIFLRCRSKTSLDIFLYIPSLGFLPAALASHPFEHQNFEAEKGDLPALSVDSRVSAIIDASFRTRFIRHLCSGKNHPRFLITEYSDFPPHRFLQKPQ